MEALLFQLVQPGAQDRHRLGAVLELRLFILAAHDQPGGQMGHADRRVGRVDTLSARPSGAEDIHPNFLRINHHLHLVGLREHRDGGGGGVDAPLRLGHRHTLDAVHAALILQPGVCAAAAHLEDHFLETTDTGLAMAQHLGLVAVVIGPARVHPEQVAGKEARLIPPVPARISTMTFLSSSGSFGSRS